MSFTQLLQCIQLDLRAKNNFKFSREFIQKTPQKVRLQLLQEAITKKVEPAVKLLLEAIDDGKKLSLSCLTTLFQSYCNSDQAAKNILLMLLAKPIFHKDDLIKFFGSYPILQAILLKDYEVTESLLKKAKQLEIDSKLNVGRLAGSGSLAAHLAVGNNDIKLLKLLIAYGSALDLADKSGKTALDLAGEIFDLQMISFLLDAVFDSYEEEVQTNIAQKLAILVRVKKPQLTRSFPLLIQKNIQSLINAFLAYPKKFNQDYQELCFYLGEKLFVILGEKTAAWYETSEERYLVPLVFFILAGRSAQAQTLKFQCYLSLLKQTGMPGENFSLLDIKKMFSPAEQEGLTQYLLNIGKYLQKFQKDSPRIWSEQGDILQCIGNYPAAYSCYEKAFSAGDVQALHGLLTLKELDKEEARKRNYLYFEARANHAGIGAIQSNTRALTLAIDAVLLGSPDAMSFIKNVLSKKEEEGYLEARRAIGQFYSGQAGSAGTPNPSEVVQWCFEDLSIAESNLNLQLRLEKLAYFKDSGIRGKLTTKLTIECLQEYADELSNAEIETIVQEAMIKDQANLVVLPVLTADRLRDRLQVSTLDKLYEIGKYELTDHAECVSYLLWRSPFASELKHAREKFSLADGPKMHQHYLVHQLMNCDALNHAEKKSLQDKNQRKDLLANEDLFLTYSIGVRSEVQQVRIILKVLDDMFAAIIPVSEIIDSKLSDTKYAHQLFKLTDLLRKNSYAWKGLIRAHMFAQLMDSLEGEDARSCIAKLTAALADPIFTEHRRAGGSGKTRTVVKLAEMLRQELILQDVSDSARLIVKMIQDQKQLPKALPAEITDQLNSFNYDDIYSLFKVLDKIGVKDSYEWKGLLRQYAFNGLQQGIAEHQDEKVTRLQAARHHQVFAEHRHTFFLDPRRCGRTKSVVLIDRQLRI